MDIATDLLRTFVAAADSASYSAAATLIHRTQSAVSMQMKRLEETVGKQLFRRNGHAMRLTEEGYTLLRYARRILKLHDEALTALLTPELSGHVRLGAPDDYAEKLLPRVLARFSGVYPQIHVDVVCEPSTRLLSALDNGRLDLAVCTNGDASMRGETIFQEQVVWVTSKHHLAHEMTPLPIAVYHEGCIFRQWAINSLEKMGRDYRIAYTSPGVAGIMAAVKGGLAVAPMGLRTLSEGIRVLRPEDGFLELPAAFITLVRAAGPLTLAVKSLAQHVSESFQELALQRRCYVKWYRSGNDG